MSYKTKSRSHVVLELKAISAEVMLVVYKLHESHKVLVYQHFWYFSVKKSSPFILTFFPPTNAPLHIRDIINSAYICNTLQCSKTDILYYWFILQQFVTTRCQCTNVRKNQPTGGGAFIREGTCRKGRLSGGYLSWGRLYGQLRLQHCPKPENRPKVGGHS